jgi:hypothetical protein
MTKPHHVKTRVNRQNELGVPCTVSTHRQWMRESTFKGGDDDERSTE